MSAAAAEMTSTEVIRIMDALEREGIDVCVDGGWGVAALLNRETREHRDLDLSLDLVSLDRARSTMERLGFRHDRSAEPGFPARFVMRTEDGRQVDFHPLVFDAEGNGWQQLSASGRSWGQFPAAELNARGSIGGRPVRCLSAALQLRFHLGYEWKEVDVHDLRLLAAEFEEVSLPPAL